MWREVALVARDGQQGEGAHVEAPAGNRVSQLTVAGAAGPLRARRATSARIAPRRGRTGAAMRAPAIASPSALKARYSGPAGLGTRSSGLIWNSVR